MTSTPVEPPSERLLSGPAKLALIAGAAGTIALFYLFISIVILVLLVWVAGELIVTLALARFGLSGFIARYLGRDVRLIGLLARSLWLRRDAQFRLKLQPAEAPGVMAILQKLCDRLQIPLPDAVYLEMNARAWVELKGLRQSLGRTSIGLGYDLLAGLSAQEIEAVLAHELVHAKLIHRFFKNWLGAGLGRAAMVSNQLSSVVDAHRRTTNTYALAASILRVADGLTRWCARLVSAYSRQDEFEADRGAAELCGSAPLRAALQRLDVLHARLERLPWNERLAQIQSAAGLGNWLVAELADRGGNEAMPEMTPDVFNHYSTHPALRDRLAALPADGSLLRASPPGLGLLADPDGVARKLVVEIERVLLAEEQKDRKELRRWLRQYRRTAHIRLGHLPGLALMVVGVWVGFVLLGTLSWYAALLITAVPVSLGWLLLKVGRYRDRRVLPQPDYPALKAAWSNRGAPPDLTETEQRTEQDLRAIVAGASGKKPRTARLVQEAYAALAQCDYLRAHVAARLAREIQPRSVEACLALAVASAAHQQGDLAEAMLRIVVEQTGLRSPSTLWGAAWATTLLRAWMPAEALIQEAMKMHPHDTTLLALLALSQSRRNKLQGALATIRRTCLPVATSTEHTKLLIGLLLDHGDLTDAAYWLQQLDRKTRDDREVQFAWVRLHLLQRNFPAAEKWIRDMEALDIPGDYLVAIGRLYESARADAQAAAFHERALTRGHYPQAHLSLARHRAKARDGTQARLHALASLDTTKTLGENAVSPYQIFPAALGQLLSLESPIAGCKAWIGGVPPGPAGGPLSKRALMIYASNGDEAARYLQVIVQAMQPDQPPLPPARFNIATAPPDLQPVQPVRPWVQHVYN